jgi:hypothetical protein
LKLKKKTSLLNLLKEHLSVFNQKYLLIESTAPLICYRQHLSEVRDQFRAPAHFTPVIGGWVAATAYQHVSDKIRNYFVSRESKNGSLVV